MALDETCWKTDLRKYKITKPNYGLENYFFNVADYILKDLAKD